MKEEWYQVFFADMGMVDVRAMNAKDAVTLAMAQRIRAGGISKVRYVGQKDGGVFDYTSKCPLCGKND